MTPAEHLSLPNAEDVRQGCLCVGREDEHVERDVLLELGGEHEVDELRRRLGMVGAAQDACELDLTEAGRFDHTGRRFLGLRIGQTELFVVLVGFAVLVGIAVMLRSTSLGKQMRALSDDFDLAAVARAPSSSALRK